MNKLSYFIFFIFLLSCTNNSTTEKYQQKRDNIINIKNKIKEINVESVLIGGRTRLSTINNYLIIRDYKSFDNLIHIFDKSNFKYIASCIHKGEGPNEITNMGHIAIDEDNHNLYITDHGKQKIFSYNIDSILINQSYQPHIKANINIELFPNEYHYINDTLSIGSVIKPTGHSGYDQYVAKWNITTGKIDLMNYSHPEIEKKRICIAISSENKIYAESYYHHDLITICDFNGNLLYNIYGPQWNSKKTNKVLYYSNIVFGKNNIIASSSFGRDNFSKDFYPTSLIIFNKDGDYIKTLETGYKIEDFCYDKDNNRVIMCLNDDIQFAYFELDDLI